MAPGASETTPLIQTVRLDQTRPRDRTFPHTTLRRFCIVTLSCVLVLAIIGISIPYAAIPNDKNKKATEGIRQSVFQTWRSMPQSWPQSSGKTYEELEKIMLETPDPARAEEWSRYYASGPHLAGKNLSQAVWTKDRWEEMGVKSEVVAYDVLLNYPRSHRLALYNKDKVQFECSLTEDVLEQDPTTNLTDRIPTFHGYSASGNVTAPYVYVNFGTFQDYEDLRNANVSLEGKIALAKYGRIVRGLKIKRAQELGMVGVVLYTDPQEDGEMTELNGYKPYPDGPARNPSSVQRGSVQFISYQSGDPTTPGYPSKPGVPRTGTEQSNPKIPSLPISYADALPLLRALNGHGPSYKDFNKYWAGGGLSHLNVSYNIGPSPENLQLNLVNDVEYVINPIWNVIGVINGTIHDEVIVLGNHRDAWIAGGAGDPNSGSSALNELIRSFGVALKQGWKPFRTVVFASWDGEEYGLVGSTEWVEEFVPWLNGSAVAYLNVDTGAQGSDFSAAASPLLNYLLRNITSVVPSPESNSTHSISVADMWNGKIRSMGSGSDFTPFQDHVGVASLDVGFKDGNKGNAVYHYHSNYDSFHWMQTYGDPGWKYHVTIAKVCALLVLKLAEVPILPMSAADYVKSLKSYLSTVKQASASSKVGSKFDFGPLDNATESLLATAIKHDEYVGELVAEVGEGVPWWKFWQKVKLYIKVKATNTQLKLLERQFTYEGGLDNRTWFKHVVFAPGRWTGYAGAVFPGLTESFEDDDLKNAEKWSKIVIECMGKADSLLAVQV